MEEETVVLEAVRTLEAASSKNVRRLLAEGALKRPITYWVFFTSLLKTSASPLKRSRKCSSPKKRQREKNLQFLDNFMAKIFSDFLLCGVGGTPNSAKLFGAKRFSLKRVTP